jgi:hypothetical protein
MNSNDLQVVPCMRCGVPCKVADKSNEEARLLQASTKPQGYCVNCGVAHFLQVESPMGQLIKDPQMLLAPHVQAQFVRVMQAGDADARPEQIDWEKVVDNWSLPFKASRRGSGRKQ